MQENHAAAGTDEEGYALDGGRHQVPTGDALKSSSVRRNETACPARHAASQAARTEVGCSVSMRTMSMMTSVRAASSPMAPA